MNLVGKLSEFLVRFRYPNSLPEEVGTALGILIDNSVDMEELLLLLTTTSPLHGNLKKYMPRKEAERSFSTAVCKECFTKSSIFSYYFKGWLEFELFFDDDEKLRRIYLQYKNMQQAKELSLPKLK